MQIEARDVTVARYGTYSDEGDSDPIAWKGGQLVEYADVLTGDGEARRMTLDQSINGERQPEGTVCDLVIALTPNPQVYYDRNGRERIVKRDKWKVLGMAPAPAPTGK